VGRQHGPAAAVARLANGHVYGIDAAHLACADADDHAAPHQHYGIALHVLAHEPGEAKVRQFLGSRRPLGYRFELAKIILRFVAILREQSAIDTAEVKYRLLAAVAERPDAQQADALLPARAGGEQLQRSVAVTRRDDALDEPVGLGHLRRGRLVHLAVEGEHAAIGAEGVALEGALERVRERRADGGAARVVV